MSHDSSIDATGLDLLASTIDRVADSLPERPIGPALDRLEVEGAREPGRSAEGALPAPLLPFPRRRAADPVPAGPVPAAPAPPGTAPTPGEAGAARRTVPAWTSWAAGLAALVLAYPAWLGWVRLPQVEEELRALEHQAPVVETPSTGPVRVVWLSPPRTGSRGVTDSRSAGDPLPTPTPVELGGPAVWLVEVPDEGRAALVNGGLLELASSAGPVIERWELRAAEIERHLETNDGIPLLIDGDRLHPGPYRLRLLAVAEHGGDAARAPLVELALELRGPAEPAAVALP